MKNTIKSNKNINLFTLFASTSTLLCCAIPITLVSLGMGAAVASLTSTLPFLVTLSEYKLLVFLVSALLIVLSFWITYRSGQSCPAEPELAEICHRAQKWTRRFVCLSIPVWSVGFFAVFLALPIRQWLGL
ncbi:MAG TPA: hypothetical protein ENJ87_01755 [Gammaproteobacteria bacterium]|nr:hypothetical protein [Gammaproteobacteria bacterium]